MSDLDTLIGRFLLEDYDQRQHSETQVAPALRWVAGGRLPRMPDSLEQLDLLLLSDARPRVVHRDGIHFEGQRYLDLTLAGYVGEHVGSGHRRWAACRTDRGPVRSDNQRQGALSAGALVSQGVADTNAGPGAQD